MATTSIVVKDVAAVVCVRKWEPISNSAPATHTQAANNTMHAGSARAEDELRYEVLVILIEMFWSPGIQTSLEMRSYDDLMYGIKSKINLISLL